MIHTLKYIKAWTVRWILTNIHSRTDTHNCNAEQVHHSKRLHCAPPQSNPLTILQEDTTCLFSITIDYQLFLFQKQLQVESYTLCSFEPSEIQRVGLNLVRCTFCKLEASSPVVLLLQIFKVKIWGCPNCKPPATLTLHHSVTKSVENQEISRYKQSLSHKLSLAHCV